MKNLHNADSPKTDGQSDGQSDGNFSFAPIEEVIADIREGKMVIIVDDEDRENEGDLIMAAARVRTEDVNFMARYGRGLICLTLTPSRCRQLRLPLMVTETDEQHSTNFTVSIEAAEGITTGISLTIGLAPCGSQWPPTPNRVICDSPVTSSRSWRNPAVCWPVPVIPKRVAT